MKKSLKIFSIVATIIVAAGAIVAGTYAFYTSYDEVSNRMEMTKPHANIIEEFDGKEKSVVISNTGKTPLLVRASAEMVCTNEGIALDPNRVAKAEYNNLLGSENYPADKWVKGEDGWYYYAKLLQPGESTSELVHILISVGDDLSDEEKVMYENATFEVPAKLEYHYPHIIDEKYPHEINWHVSDGFIKEMLRDLADRA